MRNDFHPTATWDTLRLRADLLRRTREFFHARSFLEVETPILSHDIVVDRHLDPIGVTLPEDVRRPVTGPSMWLQTSPEFGMKRLMASGAEAIYQITRVFRAGEVGPLHNPEFTMVEWYRRGDSYEAGMQLLAELATVLLGLQKVNRVTYRELFVNTLGIEIVGATSDDLRRHAAIDADDRPLLLDAIFSDLCGKLVEPTIVYDFPAEQAALARVRAGNPPVAERFELIVKGVELANGYHELLDSQVLRERIRIANAERLADGKPPLPAESRLLSAMDAGLPPCTGCALGFDRLVMLAAGVTSIQETIAFPIGRA